MKEFIATYGEVIQVSCDDYKYHRTSKIFNEGSSLKDILEWLESMGVRNPCVTMVDFSTLDKK